MSRESGRKSSNSDLMSSASSFSKRRLFLPYLLSLLFFSSSSLASLSSFSFSVALLFSLLLLVRRRAVICSSSVIDLSLNKPKPWFFCMRSYFLRACRIWSMVTPFCINLVTISCWEKPDFCSFMTNFRICSSVITACALALPKASISMHRERKIFFI